MSSQRKDPSFLKSEVAPDFAVPILKATTKDVKALLLEVWEEKPEELLLVWMKGGEVRTRSTGTFSRMRTLGALEFLKHDILAEE